MKNHRKFLWCCFSIFGICALANGQDTTVNRHTSNHEMHPDMQWFKDAKFGLFIHWGLYSHLAGTYKGKNYYGSGEWIMHQAKIPAAEYAKVAAELTRLILMPRNGRSWQKMRACAIW